MIRKIAYEIYSVIGWVGIEVGNWSYGKADNYPEYHESEARDIYDSFDRMVADDANEFMDKLAQETTLSPEDVAVARDLYIENEYVDSNQ